MRTPISRGDCEQPGLGLLGTYPEPDYVSLVAREQLVAWFLALPPPANATQELVLSQILRRLTGEELPCS